MPEVFTSGTVLRGTYRLEREIGSGGMGSVFRAVHLRTQGPCAIKLLRSGEALDANVARRFRQEAEVLARIRHPSIVAVYDFDTTDGGTPFIAMDLVEGESLATRLERGPLGWQRARTVFVQLADALTAAHGGGVVHRDVKPANVILARGPDGSERAVLLDFGLAGITDGTRRSRITASGAVLGTPLYLSPEQARGEEADARSDVYAAALVLYEMLAGVSAVAGNTIAAVIHAILESPPLPLSQCVAGLPPALDPVIARALAKNRDERFATAREFADAVLRVESTAAVAVAATVPAMAAVQSTDPRMAWSANTAPGAATPSPWIAATVQPAAHSAPNPATQPMRAAFAFPQPMSPAAAPAFPMPRERNTLLILVSVAAVGLLAIGGTTVAIVLDRAERRAAREAIAAPPVPAYPTNPAVIVTGPSAPHDDPIVNRIHELWLNSQYRECVALGATLPLPHTDMALLNIVNCQWELQDYAAVIRSCGEAAQNMPSGLANRVCGGLMPTALRLAHGRPPRATAIP